jgi:predicted ArsR family transcriptional regulator
MSERPTGVNPMSALDVPLERDVFARSLIRELSGLLEDMVGLEDAVGFISVVGQRIGADIEGQYKRALRVSGFTRRQLADVLQDLKARIQGDFYVIDANDQRIVFGNRKCPFGEKVAGRPSLCMMTSNVFGTIAAHSVGYAKVALEETIANGASECRVTVFLEATDEAEATEGREYFSGD